jgi:hypothetical protein
MPGDSPEARGERKGVVRRIVRRTLPRATDGYRLVTQSAELST